MKKLIFAFLCLGTLTAYGQNPTINMSSVADYSPMSQAEMRARAKCHWAVTNGAVHYPSRVYDLLQGTPFFGLETPAYRSVRGLVINDPNSTQFFVMTELGIFTAPKPGSYRIPGTHIGFSIAPRQGGESLSVGPEVEARQGRAATTDLLEKASVEDLNNFRAASDFFIARALFAPMGLISNPGGTQGQTIDGRVRDQAARQLCECMDVRSVRLAESFVRMLQVLTYLPPHTVECR
jgi:hypothetical protein